MFLGVLLGLAIALFLNTIIANTPVQVVSENLRWLYLVSSASGALAGFTIESTRQLQQSSSDPAYHQIRSIGRASQRHDRQTTADQNHSDL